MGLHYATQIYKPLDPAAYTRLLRGLECNLQLPDLQAATVFLDDCSPPWIDERVHWIPRKGRASFADFLRIADTNLTGQFEKRLSSHLLFANSDIVFDDTASRLMTALSEPGWAACLTRRELDGAFPAGIEPLQSQDAWMLRRQPLDPRLIDQMEAVRLGVAGCEHLFAAALVAHGFELWNPCEDCHALHTDPAPVKYSTGGERYWGLYAYVPGCKLEDVGNKDPGICFSYAKAPGHYYNVQIG